MWRLLVLLVAFTACRNGGVLDTEYRQAESWFRANRNSLALPHAEEGLKRSVSAHDLRYEWRFRLLKAEILLNQRHLPECLAVLNVNPPEGADWIEVRGRRLLLQGAVAYVRADNDRAHELFNSAADAAQQAGSPSLAAEVDLRRGPLLIREEKASDGEALLRNVLKAGTTLGDPYLEARAAINLGFTMQSVSRYEEAIEWFDRAGALFRKLGGGDSVVGVNGNMGQNYFWLGDYTAAAPRFKQAQEASVREDNPADQQVWIAAEGNIAFEHGDYAAAVKQYRRALEIARGLPDKKWARRWLGNLAETLIHMDDLPGAEAYNNQALELSRGVTDSEPYCLYNAARIAAERKDAEGADRIFRKALTLPAEDPTIRLDIHRELANLYIQTGRPREADAEFRDAIAGMDRIGTGLLKVDSRLSYLDSLIRFHSEYIDFLMQRKEFARALEVAESSRAKVLAQGTVQREAGHPQTEASFRALAGRANAVVLEYWIGKSQSYLWVVTRQGTRPYTLPPESELRALVDTYQKSIMAQENPLDTAASAGQKLRDLLLSKAMDEPCKGCRFLIVPDKLLYSLNFESLPGKRNDHFLIEDTPVTVAPSLNYLTERQRPPQPPRQTALLLIGDPDPALPQYPKLDYAGREIDRIKTSWKDSKPTVLRGAHASPESYRAAQPGNFDFIHFASHAEANPLSPLSSAVILSGAPEKCRLFARDVAAIHLDAELVAVSACRSLGAKTYSGEGPVGFAWAFLKAGARNVIAGLWDVNDRSTASLMGDLYGRIAGGATVADALRASKLALIDGGGSYSRPYFWAPFELYTGEVK